MRIAGGVLLLIAGLWSLIGGSCALSCGSATSLIGGAAVEVTEKLTTHSGEKLDAKAQETLDQAKSVAGAKSSRLVVSGLVILVGGILCCIAAILFFVNTGKTFGFIAPAVGILGEILFFVLVGAHAIWLGVTKILVLALGAFAATKIGQPP